MTSAGNNNGASCSLHYRRHTHTTCNSHRRTRHCQRLATGQWAHSKMPQTLRGGHRPHSLYRRILERWAHPPPVVQSSLEEARKTGQVPLAGGMYGPMGASMPGKQSPIHSLRSSRPDVDRARTFGHARRPATNENNTSTLSLEPLHQHDCKEQCEDDHHKHSQHSRTPM